MYPYIEAKLFRRKEDLTKRWYIEFGAWNEQTGSIEKKKIYCPAKFKTANQREIWARAICAEINAGLQKGALMVTESNVKQEPEKLKLISSFSTTLDNIKKTIRSKSAITYNSAIKKLQVYTDKIDTDFELLNFTSTQTIAFRDYLLNELNNSPRTANNTIEHLNTIYIHLSSRKALPASPFKIKKLKEEVTSKNIAFSDVDRRKIEDHLREHEPELYLFTRIMYYAFIRPGELNHITLADVRLIERYILIRGTVSKNGKTETVQIIPPLFEALKQVNITDEKQFFYLFGKGLIPSRYLSAKEVAFRRHQKVLEKIGLKETGYTLYSWKHTGAVNAYRAGVGVKELQKLLRHSSVSVTDIYLKSLGLRTDPNIQNYSW
ncbi:tyrosine-type recombinase/integrase [Dyadobacter psychrotolerans]|uniref:Site-specific integrase n=1 Tax=Dyadobacter psychrotolerans TaxID=2541721 RepID=A0A4R5DSH4_9BACT|nr:site-specific integrase [Dyadobacter psychrotolerans]TDE15304.1 site-specific integrase [Dyadobacter psychrotolerans]